MSKRFTDSEKWKKKWFRNLPDKSKLFWSYLLDSCSVSGIWDVDFELAQFFCGKLDIEKIKKDLFKQYIEIEDGKRWFIKDFVLFQYGQLGTHPFHQKIKKELEYYNLFDTVSNTLSDRVYDRSKEVYKEKDKVIEKVKEKTKHLEYVFLTDNEYEKLKDKFGDTLTQDYIENLNDYIGSKGKKYKSHYHTILMWVKKDRPRKQESLKLPTDKELEKWQEENK